MTDFLYDPIRKQKVADEPEERVRQALIHRMVNQLGYPPTLLAVEKKLSQLPHISHTAALLDRRVDLLVYRKNHDGELHPLLLVECKAIPLTDAAMHQVQGYNQYVGAAYFAYCNEQALRMGWWDATSSQFQFVDFLPRFDEL